METFTPENLLAWCAQAALLVASAAVAIRLLRLRASRWRLGTSQLLLLGCLFLPLLQPWRQPAADPEPAADRNARRAIPAPRSHSLPFDWVGALPWILAAVAAGRLCWLGLGAWKLRDYRSRSVALNPGPKAIAEAKRLAGATAEIRVSDDIPGPVTFGWSAPVILVTGAFPNLPYEQQLAIGCHELLHVRRHDWLASVVEEICISLLWFQPAVWWLAREIRLLREQVVDAESVRTTGSRPHYIQALLAIAQDRPELRFEAAPFFLKRRHLSDRVKELLKEATMSRRTNVVAYATVVTTLAATSWIAIHALPLTAAPQEQSKPADDAKLAFPDTGAKRIQLAGQVAASKIRYKPSPKYPALAKQARMQGVVRLAVLISADGPVLDLYTISGEPVLAEAAEEAVRNWVYATTHLNGEPVEVVTTVDVTFTLSD